MSVALLQDTRFSISYKKQVDLVTALTATDMWTLELTNDDPIGIQPINEDNAADKGKGVYATQTYPSHIASNGSWNGRLTSEAACMLTTFGIGATTKVAAGTGGFKYTSVAPDLLVTGLDLPAASAVVKIGSVRDILLAGICLEEFGFQLQSGPGRDNATFTSQWLGTGKYTKPSGITQPAAYTEHSLNAGGITALTLVGFDYLASKRFSQTNFNWKNNIRDQSSYFPGSGSQGGYQLRGRMRRGVPGITLTSVVECDSGSNEEDALLAQTVGTGSIILPGAAVSGGGANHQLKVTFHRLLVNVAPIGNADGIASYNITYSVQQHATNGVLTFETICEQDNILG
jgi:hypothetical protein